MLTILNAGYEPGCAGRSRFVIPEDELQFSAETVFKAAAQLTASGTFAGDLPLYEHLSAIARGKGFQHCSTILALVQQPKQAERVLALVRDAIALMGGPGEFFDALDLITAPEAGRPQ